MELKKLPVNNDVPISEVIKVLNMLIDGGCVIEHWEVHTTEPEYREGTVVWADGVDFDPQSIGYAGLYEYREGKWNKLIHV